MLTIAARVLRVVGEIAGVVVLAVALVAGGLAWRLHRRPLDVTPVARLAIAHWAPRLAVEGVFLVLDGPDLRVTVTGAQADGVVDGPTLSRASVTLEVLPLLRGALRPRAVAADGVHLHATRALDGSFTVQGLRGVFRLPDPDRIPGPPDRAGDSSYPAILGGLAHVALRDASLSLDDAASRQTGALQDVAVDIRRDPAGALLGFIHASLAVGDVSAPISIDAQRLPGDTPIDVHASVGSVDPATIAHLAPGLAPLAALDAAVTLRADLTLGPALNLRRATLHAESGPGRAFLPAKGGGTSPAAFAALSLDANGDAHAVRLDGLRIVLSPSASPATTVLFTGAASRSAGQTTAHLHVTLDRAQMADLGAMWPVGVGGGARPWLVENAVAGSVHDGAFDLTLQGGTKPGDLTLTGATGALLADDVTLFWLRPVPPLDFPHVVLTLLDPDTLTIAAPVAHQGPLLGQKAFMRIWGLSTKDQFSQIDSDINGAIPDVFALLAIPRLKLLSAHPLPITSESGQSATHLTVKLPLEAKVTMDSIGIHAVSHLTDVRVPHLATGRAMEGGVFDVDVSPQGLSVDGTARVAGIASAVSVGMDFRAGPPDQVVERATVTARADEKMLGAAGLNTAGLLAGPVAMKLDYQEQRDGLAMLKANADLGEAQLSTPLGWSKLAGSPASLEVQAVLNHGRLAGFDGLRAEGPGLSVRGHGQMVNGAPAILQVERCVIGRTNLTGIVQFPQKQGDALQVTASGPLLDLSGPLSSKTTFEPSTPDAVPPGRPYRVELHFDRVIVSETAAGIGPVAVSVSGDERRIATGHASSGGAEHVEARIEPQGDGRRLSVSVGDLGALLHHVGAGTDIDQGAAVIEGAFDDRRPGSPLTATATVTRFGVRGASVLGKLLQGMTLYGLVDALRGPGLVFDQLNMPFTLVNAQLQVREARAFSSSLGVTASGLYDLRRNVVDMTGTIVPAYFFNTLPGKVPLIGRLFSPEAGGGVFAATYGVHGPAANPAVSVNPLAALAPGMMRGLFGLFK